MDAGGFIVVGIKYSAGGSGDVAATPLKTARVELLGNQTIATGTFATIDWETSDFDTDDWWEGVTNPERLTVPAGVEYAEATFSARFGTGNNLRYGGITLNGVNICATEVNGFNSTNGELTLTTGPIAVVEGDYFAAVVNHTHGSNLDVLPDRTAFSVKSLAGSASESAGDVVGPASATDGNFALFDTGTGSYFRMDLLLVHWLHKTRLITVIGLGLILRLSMVVRVRHRLLLHVQHSVLKSVLMFKGMLLLPLSPMRITFTQLLNVPRLLL